MEKAALEAATTCVTSSQTVVELTLQGVQVPADMLNGVSTMAANQAAGSYGPATLPVTVTYQ